MVAAVEAEHQRSQPLSSLFAVLAGIRRRCATTTRTSDGMEPTIASPRAPPSDSRSNHQSVATFVVERQHEMLGYLSTLDVYDMQRMWTHSMQLLVLPRLSQIMQHLSDDPALALLGTGDEDWASNDFIKRLYQTTLSNDLHQVGKHFIEAISEVEPGSVVEGEDPDRTEDPSQARFKANFGPGIIAHSLVYRTKHG